MQDSYFDNIAYTANELNGSAKAMGAENFSYFKDGQSYLVDDLNNITKAVVDKGVLLTKGQYTVTLSGNTAVVSSGEAVFQDGVRRWDDVSTNLPLLSATTQYVYLSNNPVTRTTSMHLSTSITGTDTIRLATITKEGTTYTVTKNDDRFCRFKAGNANGSQIVMEYTVAATGSYYAPNAIIWSAETNAPDLKLEKYSVCTIEQTTYFYRSAYVGNIPTHKYLQFRLKSGIVDFFIVCDEGGYHGFTYKSNVLVETCQVWEDNSQYLGDTTHFIATTNGKNVTLKNGPLSARSQYPIKIKFF